jgi:hypothetical protein
MHSTVEGRWLRLTRTEGESSALHSFVGSEIRLDASLRFLTHVGTKNSEWVDGGIEQCAVWCLSDLDVGRERCSGSLADPTNAVKD